MNFTFNPVRLFIEVLAILALTQAALLLGLPLLDAGALASSPAPLSAALLLLLAGPAVYWRCMAAARRAPAAARHTNAGTPGVRWAIAMTALAQALGLATTAAAVAWQQRALNEAARGKFEHGADRIETEIQRRLAQPLYGLHGARGLYAAGREIDAAALRGYVQSRNLKQEFPGVRGFGFIQHLPREELAALEAQMQAAGAPGFSVQSSGSAGDLYVVKHIEPLAVNRAAWGYDIGHEAAGREAAERAVNTGEAALSGRITLVQDDPGRASLTYMVPVYKRGSSADTPRQRQESLVGLFYAPMVVAELMTGVADAADNTLDFELFDSDPTQASQLLFDHDHHLDGATGTLSSADFAGRLFESARRFSVGGRELALRVSTTPAFEAAIDRSGLVSIAVGGALASFMLAFAVWMLAAGRLRALNHARRMTTDLDRLARVVKHTSNAVIITDAALRITWVNDGFTRMTGYAQAEVAGRTPGEMLGSGEADPSTLQTLLDSAAAGVGCRVEVLNRTKDGREYWVDTEVQPMHDAAGALHGFMEISTDITARKQATAEATRAQAALHGAIETIDEAFVLFDPEDRLVLCNDRYRQVYPGIADLIVPGARFEDLVRADAQRGNHASADGRAEEWVAERMAAHRAANSTVVQALSDGRTLRIVERRMADGHTVGFRIDITDFVKATAAAEAASRAKSRFLANMSHEIRTPMSAVLGMLKLLCGTPLEARQLDYATKAAGAARALLVLLNDILDFSKVEAGKMTLDPRPFSVERLVHDVSVILQASAGSKPITMRLDIDPRLPPALLGDDLRLQQVLINLGGNAIKFTSAGKVELRLRAVELGVHDVLLEVAVQDSGIGIAPEHQAHIFSGFSQAEASTTRRFGGTGLGLAISQHLVELMGGTLRVNSTLGVGSTFHFQLRLPRAQPPAHALSPVDPMRPLLGLRLLVVEDNPNNRQIALELLQAEGASVTLAANGALGIAAAAAATPPFDAVLMDLQMPVMDGYAAAALIRRQLGRAAPPIIAMTANALASDRQACLDAGMADHVGKPFDLAHLVGVLCRFTGRAGPTAQPAQALEGPPDSLLAQARKLGIDLGGALHRMGGNQAAYRRMLESFRGDLAALTEQFSALLQGHAPLQAAQRVEAGRLMHTVKGLAAALGVESLALVAAQTEQALHGAEWDGQHGQPGQHGTLAEALHAANVAAQWAMAQLGEALRETMPDEQARTDRTRTEAWPEGRCRVAAQGAGAEGGRKALQELAAALRDADMRAVDVFETLKQTPGALDEAALQPLGEAIAALDFETALTICRALHEAVPP